MIKFNFIYSTCAGGPLAVWTDPNHKTLVGIVSWEVNPVSIYKFSIAIKYALKERKSTVTAKNKIFKKKTGAVFQCLLHKKK